MRRTCLLLLAIVSRLAAADTPADLLAKARAAFEKNRELETHWNWTRTESRTVVDRNGKMLQELPGVTIESTVRSDGRRCEAVLAWNDGVKAYKVDGESDERCQATEPSRSSSFSLLDLLKTRKATIRSQTATGITLVIRPNKELLRSPEERVRCAASIRATVVLDPATLFPRRLEGRVVELGCDQQTEIPPTYYGEKVTAKRARNLFHKGTKFRFEFELQADKFQNAARSYWARTRQHLDTPRWNTGGIFIYWGRSVSIESDAKGQRIVEDFKLDAKEFGVESRIVP